ncbi:hypothetical protein Hanom_Chr10g00882841 [Helianthus anomalus]
MLIYAIYVDQKITLTYENLLFLEVTYVIQVCSCHLKNKSTEIKAVDFCMK